MDERILTADEIRTRTRNEVEGLYFLFRSQELSEEFNQFALDTINNSSPDQLASVLADAVSFHLTERTKMENRIKDLEEQLNEMKLSVIETDNNLELVYEDNTKLKIEVEKYKDILDMYKQKGITGDSPVVTSLLATINTLTDQIVALTKTNGESIQEITATALDKITEVSNREIQYPTLPETQVHVITQQAPAVAQHQPVTPNIQIPTKVEGVGQYTAKQEEVIEEVAPVKVGDDKKIIPAQAEQSGPPSLEDIIAMNKSLSGG